MARLFGEVSDNPLYVRKIRFTPPQAQVVAPGGLVIYVHVNCPSNGSMP